MLLAAIGTIYIVFIVVILALCKAAGQADIWEEKWIEQRKLEEKEFDGWKYCEDDCYQCDYQDLCKKSAMREL
jgi:hypothetical protein